MSLFPKFKTNLAPPATSATPATQLPQSRESRESRNTPVGEMGYGDLYRQAAEDVRDDCWSIPPAWLLDHPAFYERIKALDGKLIAMEQAGAAEQEYSATLALLVGCIQDAHVAYEKEAWERATQ